jgi:transcriptional regulator with XRE-family HTH domain
MPNVQSLSDSVAEEIRAMLARRRISGRQLAEKMGVSRSWISYRLTGSQEIGLNDLERIADALGVDVFDLLPAREQRGVNYASSPATPRTMPAPAPRHPVTVGQKATAVAVRTRTIGPRTSRPLWRHG